MAIIQVLGFVQFLLAIGLQLISDWVCIHFRLLTPVSFVAAEKY